MRPLRYRIRSGLLVVLFRRTPLVVLPAERPLVRGRLLALPDGRGSICICIGFRAATVRKRYQESLLSDAPSA